MPTQEGWTLTGDTGGALLFMGAAYISLDAVSALNSSPWTSENFGASPQKAATSREYVMHAVVVSSGFAIVSAMISKSWWPIVGVAGMNGYLWWIYNRALTRAAASGSTNWGQ